jgi:protein tyrosine phosphatase
MVLENSCPAIVMLTRLKEGGRVKCGAYFPEKEGQTMQFGSVTVTCKVGKRI